MVSVFPPTALAEIARQNEVRFLAEYRTKKIELRGKVKRVESGELARVILEGSGRYDVMCRAKAPQENDSLAKLNADQTVSFQVTGAEMSGGRVLLLDCQLSERKVSQTLGSCRGGGWNLKAA